MTVAYDTFQNYYNDTRRADPGITASLIDLFAPNNNGCYLDLACGTGNYTTAVSSQGFMLYGVNQSEKMLTTARQKSTNVQWF